MAPPRHRARQTICGPPLFRSRHLEGAAWEGLDSRDVRLHNHRVSMKLLGALGIAVALLGGSLAAQEPRPVKKNEVRVSIPGCTKGYVFTVGPRTEDQPGTVDLREGMHLRMTGPKKLIGELKAHEGSMVEITGTMKKGQPNPEGIGIGGGVRVTPGIGPNGSGGTVSLMRGADVPIIDLEGWRPAIGTCPSR